MPGPPTDPKIEALFDSLKTLTLENDYQSLSVFANHDGRGTRYGVEAGTPDGGRWNFSKDIPGARLVIDPGVVSLGPNETQQFTAMASNPDGSEIEGASFRWSLEPGALGKINVQTGLYRAPAAIPAQRADVIRCKLVAQGQQGPPAWAMTSVGLHP